METEGLDMAATCRPRIMASATVGREAVSQGVGGEGAALRLASSEVADHFCFNTWICNRKIRLVVRFLPSILLSCTLCLVFGFVFCTEADKQVYKS